MILVTGGLGFIGLHTARALLDAGEDVVLTQYRVARDPDFLRDAIGTRAFVEQLDVTDRAALDGIGRRYEIDGIIHLATPGLGALGPSDEYRVNMDGLLNMLEAAQEWGVRRLSVASSVSVYSGVEAGPFLEEMPLRMTPGNPIEAYKKAYELLGSHFAGRTGLNVIMLRIAGIYGPLYHSMANLPSRLVHAAVRGEAPDMRGQEVFEDDAADLCYVKDCARGIALLQTAAELRHTVYNVSLGRATTVGELAEAIRSVMPEAQVPLSAGSGQATRRDPYSDISRLREDTGFEAEWPAELAIPDYIGWLRDHEQ